MANESRIGKTLEGSYFSYYFALWCYLRTGCAEECLDLKERKLQKVAENCIIMSFIIYTPYLILLERSNQGK
jgi:hypothetical protein